MAGLLNTSSCAPANLEAGDSEEIAQVDALLLMSDLQWSTWCSCELLALSDSSQVGIVPSSTS
jgi:hypothetical protein